LLMSFAMGGDSGASVKNYNVRTQIRTPNLIKNLDFR
jgi:hypothetical protein